MYWIINLKDNRKSSTLNDSLIKFEFCKNKSIIGIGWGNHSDNDNKAYQYAKRCLSQMNKGDIAWIKIPNEKEYYMCKVVGIFVDLTDNNPDKVNKQEYLKKDISAYRKVEFYRVNTVVQDAIDYKKLISRTTVRPIKKKETIDFIENCAQKEGII